MEESEVQQFKRILRSLLDRQTAMLWRRDEIAVDKSPDAMDQVQNAIERELAVRRLQSDSERVRDILTALHHIEEGTYGECVRCEAIIGTKRLEAVPWTSYCLLCQDLADQERRDAFFEEFVSANVRS